ncbi:hypothetical protein M426DRAFT_26532 [Hypoxylon sp. CI-4A]|nr:hypothetical protein M426DRAFT_26532 [Hypoxylon sp. CI-4A]
MRFSTHGSAAVAMAASLASATAPASVAERHLLDLDVPKDLSEPISANVDIGVDLSGLTLAAGVLANVAVPPVAGVSAGVDVAVVCDTCYTKGNINASISLDKVVPALSLSLTDIEAKLDLDIFIGAGATIAVNLFTPEKPISLPLPGLDVSALISLDLVLGVETAIDLSAGIDVKLVDEATIETDILAGKILDAAFSGLSVQVLPIEVRIGCTKLLADLRLRVELGVAVEVDIDDVLPILDLPEIGAGLEVAVFANLLEYVGFFCATPECPLSKESYGLNIGAAVELDVAIEDLLSIHLAPTLSTALLSYPTSTLCVQPSYTPVPTISASTSSFITSSISTGVGSSPSESASASESNSNSGSDSASASASESGSASATGSGSVTATATATGPGSYPVATTSSAAAVTSAPSGSITSTVTNTQTFTITQCAANVPNCPAGYQTTATLIHTTVYTTVCPATQTEAITAPPKATHTKSTAPVTITKSVVTLVPCSSQSTFTPPTNFPTAPYPVSSKPATSTAVTTGSAPVTTPGGKPTGSYTGGNSETLPTATPSSATGPSTTPGGYPVGTPSVSSPAGSPSESSPAGSPSSATYPAGSPSESSPAGSPSSATYPAGSASETYPAGSPSETYPAGSPSETYPAGSPSGSAPAGSLSSATYPAGSPSSVTYPAGSPSSATYPVGTPSETYPAGSPSGSAPAGGPSSYPAGTPPAGSYPAAGPTGSYPVGGGSSVPYPTVVPPYPTGPAGGANGTASASTSVTLSTYQPSASASFPTTPSYPTGGAETPIPTAGAAKVGSGVAGVFAIVGAFAALM